MWLLIVCVDIRKRKVMTLDDEWIVVPFTEVRRREYGTLSEALK